MKKILVLVMALMAVFQLASAQTREDFTLGGMSAFVIVPANPAPGKPWIAYGPSVGGLPHWSGTGEEKWMFDRYFAAGITVAGIYSGDLSGNVAQRAGYTLLYNELVNNRGYSKRFCFHARSRGGLISYNWTADNPGKVAAIGGIYPVNNLLSYPGEATAATDYGVTVSQLNANIALYNPIERLAPLLSSGVKMYHIHGDNDALVPVGRNSQITKDRYDALGGTMTLKVLPGGHDLNNQWFQDQDLTDFMITRSLETVSITGPPTLNTQTLVTPANGATNVAPSSNLTASFNEAIVLTGTGSILLKNLSGGADMTINLPNDVSISANILTINPPKNLINGQQYAVEISNNAVRDFDLISNNYAGLQATSSPNWNFAIQALLPTTGVVNPSFELDAVADGSFGGASATGWTKTGPGIAGPQDFTVTLSPQATDGEQHAFANGGNSLSQVSQFTVAAGKTYTLLVDVGQLSDFQDSQGIIHLFGSTQGINTPLANANGTAQLASIAPPPGSYLTNRTVTYTALSSGDPFLGQQIGVALVGQSGTQVLFDNVRITQAQPLSAAVANPSFELDAVADGSFGGAGAAGWTKTGPGIAGPQDFTATQNPQATNGEQHAFANGGNSLSQVSQFTVAAGKTYTLLVDVGQLSNFDSSQATIRLFGSTQGIGTPLANANGTAQLASIAPTSGSYLTSRTVTYTALAIGDPFLGQQIGVALVGQSGIQVLFDNVRLTQSLPHTGAVVNSSFELDVLADGSFSSAATTGWTKTGSGIAGPQDFTATQNPQATNGEQHAYANGGNSLSQLTQLTVEAGQTYTLLVDVGQLSDFQESQATIRLFGSTQGVNTPLANANGTAQLASIAPTRGSYLTNRTVTYTALASGDPFLGQQIGIALVGQSGIQVLFDNVRFTSRSNNYSAGINRIAIVRIQGDFNHDADGDSIPNGVESFFGSNPNVTNLGFTPVGKSGSMVMFQHPETTKALSDVVGTYQWSLDLISWHAAGATSDGVTIAIPEPPPPTVGMTTVTATVTAGTPTKLFLRLVVTQF